MSAPIFPRAPLHVRYSREYLFEPKFVSIGPLYYEKLKEQTTIQKAKVECISYFASKLKTSTSNLNINDHLRQFNVLADQQMKVQSNKWYSKNFGLNKDEFFTMLVRDCCFIIRILLAFSREGEEFMLYPEVDINILRFDLLLVENQIPFFFLERVYYFLRANTTIFPPVPASELSLISNSNSPTCPQGQTQTNTQLPDPEQGHISQTANLVEFLKELKPFIWLDMPWQFNEQATLTDPKHMLDLYWRWCLPSPLDGQVNNAQNLKPHNGVHASWEKIHARRNAPKRIKNAYELYLRAGVSFQKRAHEDGFGITFRNGILKIPHLQLDTNQITLLANLVAFEEFKPSKDRLLTSYVLLMDGLINTKKDVDLLHHLGLITNKLSSTQMAPTYFNEIGHFCSVDNNHYFRKQFADLNNYYYLDWNRQYMILKHKYFNDPWAANSLIGGTLLLILTVIQTLYTVYDYYQNRGMQN